MSNEEMATKQEASSDGMAREQHGSPAGHVTAEASNGIIKSEQNGASSSENGLIDDDKLSREKRRYSELEKEDEEPVVKTYGISKIKYPQNSIIVPSRKPNLRYIPLKTGLCYDVRMRYHAKIYTSYSEYIDPHPEDPRRIYRIYKILAEEGLINDPTLSGSDDIGDLMIKIPVREASEAEILEVHTKEHLNFLKTTTSMSKAELLKTTETGDSVYFNHDSFFCAKLSCGGVIEACKAVVEGKVKNSLAIVRPPGHHSEPEAPGGFCLFSNVAVAAKNILKNYSESVRKIVILDWDVHHGNGTQKCFYDDPRVLYISLHRYEPGKYYPGTPQGDYDQAGTGAGLGYNLNIPWPQGGMGDADYIYAFTSVIIPVCVEFNPDLVIVSSGFDAADGDMIGQCHVSPGCYGYMVNMLKNLAKGHLCVALEGGYNLDSISISALAVAKALLGEPPEELRTTVPCSAAVETIHKVKELQSKYWKCMKPGFASLGVVTTSTAEEEDTLQPQKGLHCLSDAVRLHQSNYWKEKYGMINLPMLLTGSSADDATAKLADLHQSSSSFDNQFLATPDVFSQETIVVVIHDPLEVYGRVDPVHGTIEPYSSVYIDPTERFVEWVVNEKKYGLIDVIVPTQITTRDGKPQESLEYNNISYSQEITCYLWDNYLKFFSRLKNLIFFGVGDSYNGIVYLLGHRQVINTSLKSEELSSAYVSGDSENSAKIAEKLVSTKGKIEKACSINFVNANSQLRPITPLLDDSLTDWFYKNSLIFASCKHPIWDNNDNYSKRPRKKFGRVLKSQKGEILPDIFQENYEEAVDFVLDTLEEFESDSEESGSD